MKRAASRALIALTVVAVVALLATVMRGDGDGVEPATAPPEVNSRDGLSHPERGASGVIRYPKEYQLRDARKVVRQGKRSASGECIEPVTTLRGRAGARAVEEHQVAVDLRSCRFTYVQGVPPPDRVKPPEQAVDEAGPDAYEPGGATGRR